MTTIARHLIIAEAGCLEVGNELEDKWLLQVASTHEEAKDLVDATETYCAAHIEKQAKLINENPGRFEWTSPYYYYVAWITLDRAISVSGSLQDALARYAEERQLTRDDARTLVQRFEFDSIGGGRVDTASDEWLEQKLVDLFEEEE